MTRARRGIGPIDGMETREQYPLTLVTAYFDLGSKQTKYADNPYPGWSRNFLSTARWPLVIFCDEQSVDMLKEARGDKPAIYHVTSLEEFVVHKYLDHFRARYESFQGVEKPPCTPEAALIYHQKVDFLRRVMSENPFGSEMLFWVDIGSFRYERKSRLISLLRLRFCLPEDMEWPNLQVCRAMPKDKVVSCTLSGYPVEDAPVQAWFFGGAIHPARRWCDAYYQLLDETWREGKVIYMEEWAMDRLRAERPDLVYVLPHDIGWLRPALFLGKLLPKYRSSRTSRWYLLSGKRLPWKYFRRRLFSPPPR